MLNGYCNSTLRGVKGCILWNQKGQKEFVQIINVGRKHWVTVTNIGCENDVVKVYNSKYMELTDKQRKKFDQCLAALLNTSCLNMTIVWPPMQSQKGCSDCGLFAVAVAYKSSYRSRIAAMIFCSPV